MSSPLDPTTPSPEDGDLAINGTIPPRLSGRMLGIGLDGVVHSFLVADGRVSCLENVRTGTPAKDIVAFDGSALIYGDDCSVRQLNQDGGPVRRVDLAGRRRTVGTC